MNWLRNFMVGRYGGDQLNIGLLVLYVLLCIINMFFSSPAILAVSYVIVILWVFRFLSRNIYKRQSENQKFLQIMKPFLALINIVKRSFREKDSKFYQCPRCHQVIRVPKGKGRIAITCPKCKNEFVKRT